MPSPKTSPDFTHSLKVGSRRSLRITNTLSNQVFGWVFVGVVWVAPEVVDGNLVAWSPIGASHATQETNDAGEQAELFEYLFETLSYQIPELGPGSLPGVYRWFS